MLGGRYVVGALLGRGGAAGVYRVQDTLIGVERALKVMIAPDDASREVLRRRLHDEARAMARLAHPNVLAVHDVGEGEGFSYVVMDLADGGSLAQRLDEGGVDDARALGWIHEVLQALGAAHAAGIVHRDVKPQNILLDRYGHAQLADFGIAMIGDDLARSTRTGMAMGSLAYMAPEQRIDARKVTPEADIYAVGATLYHLVTGQSPMDLFMAGEHSDRMADVPPALREVIFTATRYEPSRRYPSAEGMARALTAAVVAGDAEAPGPLPSASAGHAPAPPARPAPTGASASPHDPYTPTVDEPAPLAALPQPGPTPAATDAPARVDLRVAAGVLVAAALLTALAWQVSAPGARRQPGATAPGIEARGGSAGTPTAGAAMDRVLSTARGRPLGVLRGTVGGRAVTFDLSGSLDNVSGVVSTTSAETTLQSRVTGRYDAGSHTLTLDAVGAAAGTYRLTFDDALSSFTGTFTRAGDTAAVPIRGS